jgi:hypothetical protein
MFLYGNYLKMPEKSQINQYSDQMQNIICDSEPSPINVMESHTNIIIISQTYIGR